ncbi:capsule assembly Wzi family protein [Spirosoma gilvum]
MRYQTEVGFYGASTSKTPFWLRSNQYGIVPDETPFMTLRQTVGQDYRTTLSHADSLKAIRRKIGFGWGAQAVINAGYSYQLLIPEAYLKLKLGRSVEVWAGRRREIIGLVDSTLSSGSYAWSDNALPLTKVQVAVQDYIPRKGFIGFKGFYAHGWFESGRFVNNAMLHQKALYARFGKPNWRLKLYAGMNHQVMWGGRTDRLSNNSTIKNNQLPNQFSDYVNVVLARSLNTQGNIDTNRISHFDQENRIGNHLGTVDLAIEYTGQSFSIFAYRQNIYEDGSLFYLTNLQDGLNGLRIRNRRPRNLSGIRIEDLLLEYLYTQSQGGSLFVDTIDKQRGRDNYFNHSQYQDGWSRYGQTIGTPFISPSPTSRSELPQYGFTNNNRVAVMHLGLSGQVLDFFSFQLKASYSENLGTYEMPFLTPIRQFSSLLTLSSPVAIMKGVTARASIATDMGDLYDNSMGFYLGVRRTGNF